MTVKIKKRNEHKHWCNEVEEDFCQPANQAKDKIWWKSHMLTNRTDVGKGTRENAYRPAKSSKPLEALKKYYIFLKDYIVSHIYCIYS